MLEPHGLENADQFYEEAKSDGTNGEIEHLSVDKEAICNRDPPGEEHVQESDEQTKVVIHSLKSGACGIRWTYESDCL